MPLRRAVLTQCIFCAFRAQPVTNVTSKSATSHGFIPRFFSTTSGLPGAAAPTARTNEHADERLLDTAPREAGVALRRVKVRGPWRATGHQSVARQRLNRTSADLSRGSLKRIVLDRMDQLEQRLRASPVFQQSSISDRDIDEALGRFRWYVRSELASPVEQGAAKEEGQLGTKLFSAFLEGGEPGLDQAITYALYNHFLGRNFSEADLENQKELADMSYPNEWYAAARSMHRTIHAHIGPTNSGKTYHALKRLETAARGVYAGPLRLLAHEVYSRLSAKGKLCSLITGEEQRLPPGWIPEPGGVEPEQRIICATVEMTNIQVSYDVAVIDEIQMLGDLSRGFAWTTAMLGLRCPEIHVCGEERALPIIQELAAVCGDKLIVHKYDRLTTLKVDKQSLGGTFENLRKGDCVVTFSVMAIHALKSEIERTTGKRVAVVYGGLPPETRAQQARLFNDPTNEYDILVASDAVGMGLNLSIKRVIFETLFKYMEGRFRKLTVPEIRQIAGRAGRYRSSLQDHEAAAVEASADTMPANTTPVDGTRDAKPAGTTHADTKLAAERPELARANPRNGIPSSLEEGKSSSLEDHVSPQTTGTGDVNALVSSRAPFDNKTIGLVTTIDKSDFVALRLALVTEPPPIEYAAIAPPLDVVTRFASYFPPGTPFSYILMRLGELGSTSRRYRISNKAQAATIADVVHGLNLTVSDLMILTVAPVYLRGENAQHQLLREMASCIVNQRGGDVLSIKSIPLEVLDLPVEGSKRLLNGLERLHRAIVLYLWLSFRFPGIFVQRPLANHVKELVEKSIEECLRLMSFRFTSDMRRDHIRKQRQKAADIMDAILQEQAASANVEGVARQNLTGPLEGQDVEPHAPQDDEGEYLLDDFELESESSSENASSPTSTADLAAENELIRDSTLDTQGAISETYRSPEPTISSSEANNTSPPTPPTETDPSPVPRALGQDIQTERSIASKSVWEGLSAMLFGRKRDDHAKQKSDEKADGGP